ncbi:DUF4253 domain-containing protein [Kitasatospora sp. NPDC048407]|uniref:DUF4253 domain-containing protein n=1 Tax=Kitasatospora sp. NPDC048407 TaxID=3364051 RepID=UPI00371FA522
MPPNPTGTTSPRCCAPTGSTTQPPTPTLPPTRTRAPNSPLVQVGFAELELSVGVPPQDHEPELRIAAEHLAFCPDDIFQGAGTTADYAPGLVNADRWSFWRD